MGFIIGQAFPISARMRHQKSPGFGGEFKLPEIVFTENISRNRGRAARRPYQIRFQQKQAVPVLSSIVKIAFCEFTQDILTIFDGKSSRLPVAVFEDETRGLFRNTQPRVSACGRCQHR
jgi:hypothetical protein